MKYSLFLPALLLGATATVGSAQAAPVQWADTVATEIDRASLSGDLAKVDAAAALASRVATAYPNDGLMVHYHGYAVYRQATAHTAAGHDVTPLFVQAQGILERSLKLRPLAETHIVLSSIDGQLIAKDPSRGMELGMRSQASASAAMKLDPQNPRVWLLRGQSAIFTPEQYGGGLAAAQEQLEHAVELFAKDAPKAGDPSWGKAEGYVWVGQVYAKKGDKAKAAALYSKALEIAPDYAFAKSAAAGFVVK